MRIFASALSIFSLTVFIWALRYLLPRARREQDWFGIVCALLTAAVTLFGFLFFAVAARS